MLAAVDAVPRELFVPRKLRERAWDNEPLPIGGGQTISQPLVVARMCELLDLGGSERVLDVGTGSGYHAALLARLAGEVWSVERLPRLSRAAAANLTEAGAASVRLVVADGMEGLPEAAPFDAINVAAAGPVEWLARLEEQLAPGGRLVAPVVIEGDQRLVLVRREGTGGVRREILERVRFVPLVGGSFT